MTMPRRARPVQLEERPSLPLQTLRLPERSPLPSLVRRVLVALGIVVALSLLLWLRRDGLQDDAHPERAMTFVDVFYFTVVSLATVGYGDITPVSQEARLLNALVITPVRLFLWVVFLGTAVEFAFHRYRERLQMDQLKKRLNGHTIICGFGVKGRAVAKELLAHAHARSDIVVIDNDTEGADAAAGQGLVALRGDAASEAILQAAGVEQAAHVLVAPDRDDASVLICLTVRHLARRARIVAAAREEENVKLLYQAGADMVVAPSVAGGRLMAAAVRQKAVTPFLEDLLAFGRGIDVSEHVVTAAESGSLPVQLPEVQGRLLLGVRRNEEHIPFNRLRDLRLRPGDVVVYLVGEEETPDHADPAP
jgi:voltage-gated potassium channel